jgi:hypothetical protein
MAALPCSGRIHHHRNHGNKRYTRRRRSRTCQAGFNLCTGGEFSSGHPNRKQTEGYNFANGFNGFNIIRTTPADNPVDSAVVQITLPAGQAPRRYFKYGPTPADPAPHWYRFDYDGVTGADFPGDNRINLYFIDGERGDSGIGFPDGKIREPSASAIALPAKNSRDNGSGGGSGCSLRQGDSGIMHSGAWVLLVFLAIVMRRSWKFTD